MKTLAERLGHLRKKLKSRRIRGGVMADYEKMKRDELIALCRARGLSGYSNKKKADLMDMLVASEPKPAPAPAPEKPKFNIPIAKKKLNIPKADEDDIPEPPPAPKPKPKIKIPKAMLADEEPAPAPKRTLRELLTEETARRLKENPSNPWGLDELDDVSSLIKQGKIDYKEYESFMKETPLINLGSSFDKHFKLDDPSGAEIDRAIKSSSLSKAELAYNLWALMKKSGRSERRIYDEVRDAVQDINTPHSFTGFTDKEKEIILELDQLYQKARGIMLDNDIPMTKMTAPDLSLLKSSAKKESKSNTIPSDVDKKIQSLIDKSQKAIDNVEKVDTSIPSLPNSKAELVSIAKEKGIKGHSGKSIADLKQLIQSWYESTLKKSESMSRFRVLTYKNIINKATIARQLLGMPVDKVQQLYDSLRDKNMERKEELNSFRSSLPRKASGEEFDRIQQLIKDQNKKTESLNDKYEEMSRLVRYVLQFLREGDKRMLLEILDYSMGIPYPLDTYLKEAGQ